MVKRNVVAAYTLNNPRVMRFEPPLIIEASQVDTALQAFREAVAETDALLQAVIG
jgi:putrescine aminotransferase